MSATLIRIRKLVKLDHVRISDHGMDEMVEDGMDVEIVLAGATKAVLVEDYPDAFKGPSILVLQDHAGKPLHVVWGLARQNPDVATLVTAYFPNSQKWYDGFMMRRSK